MDILKMLSELREERESIEQAIMVIERLATGQGKRRGRPPAWMSRVSGATQNETKNRVIDGRSRAWTPERRKAASDRAKAKAEKKEAAK